MTGASRGVGRHLALGLAEAGLDVALLARDEPRLAEVADEIRTLDRRATVLLADVTAAEDVERAIRRAEQVLGSIDLLVNNAGGVDAEVPIWQADPQQWWQVVETNVRGPFLLTHATVPGMLSRGGGRIVNLNSGAGTVDWPTATAYSVSKTALFRISGALHAAGYDQGLRAFELAPGVVHTDMTQGLQMHAGRTEWTNPAAVVELLVAIARGELDALSGRFLRAGIDTPASLRRDVDALDATSRRLGIQPS